MVSRSVPRWRSRWVILAERTSKDIFELFLVRYRGTFPAGSGGVAAAEAGRAALPLPPRFFHGAGHDVGVARGPRQRPAPPRDYTGAGGPLLSGIRLMFVLSHQRRCYSFSMPP